MAAILRAGGLRTGLYTSPHLVDFPERVLVDGVPIPEGAVAAWTERLRPVAEERQASFFEITTALALADFAARGVEIAVVEVGLGGRLDATNVLEPVASGVTRIALEHTDYLGPDLASIAREKAGIAKPGVPLLTTETDEAVLDVMRLEAGRLKSEVTAVDPRLAAPFTLALAGPHQVANASLAVALVRALPAAVRPDEAAITAGLASARIAGRFDRRGPWLFDVAHNPDGARALAAALREARERGTLRGPLHVVAAIFKDKDWAGMLEALSGEADGFVLTRAPSAPADRAWDLGDAVGLAASRGWTVAAEPELAHALASARHGAGTVVVTGSFTTVGDAMRLLGFDPLA